MFIYSATAEQISSVRSQIESGIDARIDWERANKTPGSKALGDIVDTFLAHKRAAAKLDGITLAFIAHNPTLRFSENNDNDAGRMIDFPQIYTSQRRGNQCFNEKALPKIYVVSRVLNGGTFGISSDDETTQGIVLALSRGIVDGKQLQFALNDYMCRGGKRASYGAGNTQSSSSLRALEALGVVRKIDGRTWQIADKGRFARLVEGAQGIPYMAPPTAPAMPLMLTYDPLPPPAVFAGDVLPADFGNVIAGVPDADVASLDAMLAALDVPAVPAKRARGKSGK